VGVAHVDDQDVLMVAGRLTEGALTRQGEDDLFLIDVENPATPTSWAQRASFTVRDDPAPVVVDPEVVVVVPLVVLPALPEPEAESLSSATESEPSSKNAPS